MKLVIYLLKKVIPLFFGSMFFVALVLNLVDLFMNIANYLQNNCSSKDMLLVMAYYTPKTIWYAVPVAILFSTSYALSEMYAANEIQALLASGVSLFRFTLPLLIVSIVMAYGLFLFENKFVVQTYEKKTELQAKLLQKTRSDNINNNVIVLSDNGKIIYSASRYIENQKKLRTCYFIFRGDERQLLAVISAKQAIWDSNQQVWILENPVQYEPVNNTLKITDLNQDYLDRLTESYEIFRKANVNIQSVSAAEAKIYIKHLKKAGLPYNEELSEYYKKFAFPFILFIVVFLSIGLTGKTRKNVLLISLASCIGASVLFYVTMMVTMVLAKHGYISAFSGAWSPVIFFTIISVVLLRYART